MSKDWLDHAWDVFAWIMVEVVTIVLAVMIVTAIIAGCGHEPTRERVQALADRALDEERYRERQCRLLSQAARVARHEQSWWAGILARDAARTCGVNPALPIWP